MSPEELQKKLLETFRLEMDEHLQTLSEVLSDTIAAAPAVTQQPAQINLLFRAVHSLKGAARSVNLPLIEDLCHSLENLLADARQKQRSLTEHELKTLLQGLDALQKLRLSDDDQPALLVAESDDSDTTQQSTWVADETSEAIQSTQSAHSIRISTERLDGLLAHLTEVQQASRAGINLLDDIEQISTQLDALFYSQIQRLKTLTTADSDVISRASLHTEQVFNKIQDEVKQKLSALYKKARSYQLTIDFSLDPLEKALHACRLQPFKAACEGLKPLIFSLQDNHRAQVELIIEGEQIELDRAQIAGLRSIFQHLIKNALDHGIEPATERITRGKPGVATILISACRVNGFVRILFSDDGSGIKEQKLRQILHDKGLPIPQNRNDLLDLIFSPGLSTANMVTKVSGRGVGLDAVRSEVRALRGTVSVSSSAEQGTHFEIHIPQSVSSLTVLLFLVGATRFAIESSHVSFVRVFSDHDLQQTDSGLFIVIDNISYPAEIMDGIAGAQAIKPRIAIILSDTRLKKALLVDDINGSETVIVKDIRCQLGNIHGLSGGAILPDNSVALVIDTAFFLQKNNKLQIRSLISSSASKTTAPATIMVVEDAITTRTLEVNVIRNAGFNVVEAVDGQQAWELLQNATVNLIISDVDMPRLNGIELTRKVRASPKWSHIPVILVTARETPEDKLEGLTAGANQYMRKSHFDQTALLQAITKLLPQ